MFRYFVLGFISALVWVYSAPGLPWQANYVFLSGTFVALVLAVLLTLFRSEHYSTLIRIIIQVIFGFLIAFLLSFFVEKLTTKLPEQAFNHKVWVTGEVIGLVTEKPSQFGQQKVQFTLVVDKLEHPGVTNVSPPAWQIFKPRIRLSWYLHHNHLLSSSLPKAGEKWRFHIKLKANHYSLNPGAFDYETYLFQLHIEAHGYIVNSRSHHEGVSFSGAKRLEKSTSWRFQQSIRQALQPWFTQSDFGGIFAALLYGDKSHISPNQWQVFRQTGTIHLMAISGLHIGIMAAIGFWLFAMVWRFVVLYFPYRSLRQIVSHTPKVMWGSLGAALFAFGYMALAGFAIPTVRAGIMVLVVLVFIALRRRFQVWSALALAAFIILLLDSRSVLSQGFWLSFIAVSIIYLVIASPSFSKRKGWQQLLWLQLALTLGMMPVLAWFYGQVPIVGFVANLIAVPFVTLLALPLLMVTVVLILVFGQLFPSLMLKLLALNDGIWQLLWRLLSSLDQFAHQMLMPGVWFSGHIALWTIVVLYVVLAIWLTFGKRLSWHESIRWSLAGGTIVVFFLLSTVIQGKKHSLTPGEVRVTLLDVGQGQAMVFETASHTLVYDTGPKFSDALDGANMAVLPYLAFEKRNQVNLLVVSHSDMDHAGGTTTFLKNIQVKQALSGQAGVLNKRLQEAERSEGDTSFVDSIRFQPCKAGQNWVFNQVHFEVLSPKPGAKAVNDNDTSCVLKVTTGNQSIMVMGDASKHIEHQLIQSAKNVHQQDSLHAQILVAGHHGSETATSKAWLSALKPQLVLFSAGYLNRYHFPAAKVVKRVRAQGATIFNTACSGAIQVKVTPNHFQIENRQRIDHKTWYHHQCSQPQSWQR